MNRGDPMKIESLSIQRQIKITKEELLKFEIDIKELYEAGKIKAPVHLSGNNEDPLIDLFQYVHPDDWVFSTWRSHYHALLHGISAAWLRQEILNGHSITICNSEHNFFSSAIVGGIIPIAVGTASGLQRKESPRMVWCFIGDMAFETGIFHESYKYAVGHNLPIRFVVEDNGLSTDTPTRDTWGATNLKEFRSAYSRIIYYKYERIYPHHGIGKWVMF